MIFLVTDLLSEAHDLGGGNVITLMALFLFVPFVWWLLKFSNERGQLSPNPKLQLCPQKNG